MSVPPSQSSRRSLSPEEPSKGQLYHGHEDDNERRMTDVPLFDLDFSSRQPTGPYPTGFDSHHTKERQRNRSTLSADSFDEKSFREDDDMGSSYDLEEGTRQDSIIELEKAICDEWDLMAIERDRCLDAGLESFGDIIDVDQYRKQTKGKVASSDPDILPRLWETNFLMLAIQNIENKPQFFFYVVSFGHVNKDRHVSGALRRRVLYTSGLYLQAGEHRAFSSPCRLLKILCQHIMPFDVVCIWPRKFLPVSYRDLCQYALTVNLWKISPYTFNTLYASTTMTLQDMVESEPHGQLILQHKLAKRKRYYEVQRIKIYSQLSEVFDFDLFFESWSIIFSGKAAKQYAKLPKLIKFMVSQLLPKGIRQPWKVRWTTASEKGFWKSPFSFVFRGTMQDIYNAYFIAKVYVKHEGKFFLFATRLVGTALMSLQSVTTYSLFRSTLKKLTIQQDEFTLGELIGSIRCFTRSIGTLNKKANRNSTRNVVSGLPYYEDPSVVKRPAQPFRGAALVTQLDFREQFLVIRLFRCHNLPAANFDSGTSDPVVKIKWDGMTNSSTTEFGTTRPVWNQNFYFPIRLLDNLERTSPAYIMNCLPIDLLSKGNIVFECWDQDEAASDFLGGCEVHLSLLLSKGKREMRCLAEGIKESVSGLRMEDGKPVAFNYVGDDAEPVNVPVREVAPAKPKPYEIPYLTHVYYGNGHELTGSSMVTSVTNKPLIYFEMFCIPPLPENLQLPAPPPVEEEDLWKQWSKRWNRDFTRWQHIYQEWFPLAPKARRFLCTSPHPQTRHLHPLPAFVTPIAVPEQITSEADLLHWITNMTFLIPSTQYKTGQFARWLSPNHFLISRRGGINDHATLLCSCLLGLNYDAYVCKGTINQGRDEHCWVMTRHEGGWVVFWEVTKKKRYHLPARWNYNFDITKNNFSPTTDQSDVSFQFESYYEGSVLRSWYTRAAHECGMTIVEEPVLDELDILEEDVVPDVRLKSFHFHSINSMVDDSSKKGKGSVGESNIKRLHDWMEKQMDSIPISPRKNLLDVNSTLVYVPYSSIEVIFNHKQLWGNVQNHHPAVIYYDLENPYLFRPFLTQDPKPIDNFIFIAPSTGDKACQLLSQEIQVEISEHVRVVRSRKGFETQIDHLEEKIERLDKYLDLSEFRIRLDEECDPGPPPGHTAWSAWGLYESADYLEDNSTNWYGKLEKNPAENSQYDMDVTKTSEKDDESRMRANDVQEKINDLGSIAFNAPHSSVNLSPQRLNVIQPDMHHDVQVHSDVLQKSFQTTPFHSSVMKNNSFEQEKGNKDKIEQWNMGSHMSGELSRDITQNVMTAKVQSELDESIHRCSVKNEKQDYPTVKWIAASEFSYTHSEDSLKSSAFHQQKSTKFIDGVCPETWCGDIIECTDDMLSSALMTSDSDGEDELSLVRYCNGRNIHMLESFTKSFSEENKAALLNTKTDHLTNVDHDAGPLSFGESLEDKITSQATKLSNLPIDSSPNTVSNEKNFDTLSEPSACRVFCFRNCPTHEMIMDDYEDLSLPCMDPFPAKNPPEIVQDALKEQATVKGMPPKDSSSNFLPPSMPFTGYQQTNQNVDSRPSHLSKTISDNSLKKKGDPPYSVKEAKSMDPLATEKDTVTVSPIPSETPSTSEVKKVEMDVPPPRIFRRPISNAKYHADQVAKWNYYYRLEALYYEWHKLHFPVRPGHTFCGFAIHFSSTDFTYMRTFVLRSRRFRHIVEVPIDGIMYTFQCKIYPLMGGVVSCWVFIGCEIPWTGKRERQTHMKAAKKHRTKERKRGRRKP